MDCILNRYCKNHHIVLRRRENLNIFLTLAWNWMLRLKLRLYKWLRGIRRPIVHYYAVCWNEEKLLPLVFDYYGEFVDKFIIYDNYSTDGSESIIVSHANAEIRKFHSNGFNDVVQNKIKNNCWKRSRGHADLVIVCDMDEFLYYTDLNYYLKHIVDNSISFPSVVGYNMYSRIFPTVGQLITAQIKTGVTNCAYSKNILFDPHRIVNIGYEPGGHHANPTGIVCCGDESVKLLHYKNLGLDYLLHRFQMLSSRLSETNKQEGLGIHYTYSIDQVEREFQKGLAACFNVIPKLSIIMPTLNSEKTIDKALSSIQQQTFTDWEVIIMDGGSTDNTMKIIDGFQEPRFKVFQEKDKGIYDAMNHGILKSNGDWLYFIGSDDYLLSNTVIDEVFSKSLNADMVYCNVQASHLSNEYLGEWRYDALQYNRCHQGVFYRRHIFDTIGYYPLQYKVCADYYINLRVFLDPILVSKYLPIEIAYHTYGGYSAFEQDYLFEKEVNYIIARYGKKKIPKPFLRKYCLKALKNHRSLSERVLLYWTIFWCGDF